MLQRLDKEGFTVIPPSGTFRELARRQAEYAALPVMAERKAMWYALNDGDARPPFVVETWTFNRDFLPDSVFRCESELGRRIEMPMLCHIRNHELIDDDKVIPDTFDVGWFVNIDEFGLTIQTQRVKDAEGVETGEQAIGRVARGRSLAIVASPPR